MWLSLLIRLNVYPCIIQLKCCQLNYEIMFKFCADNNYYTTRSRAKPNPNLSGSKTLSSIFLMKNKFKIDEMQKRPPFPSCERPLQTRSSRCFFLISCTRYWTSYIYGSSICAMHNTNTYLLPVSWAVHPIDLIPAGRINPYYYVLPRSDHLAYPTLAERRYTFRTCGI